jgi:hypothetical protein
MDVDGLPNLSEEQLQALEVKSRLVMSPKAAATLHCDDSPSYDKSTCVPAPKPAKKRVGFSPDLPKMAGKRHTIAEEGSPSPEPADEDLEVTEVDELCSRLSQIPPQQSSTRMPSPCLGYLSGTDDYRYLIYKTSQLIPNTRDRSLQELLQSESKEMRLSVKNRLQIAFTLALSPLQLYSSPWIKKRWRSRDVVLFREDKHKWSPYVAAAFNSIRQGQFSKSSIDVTNDRGSKLKNSAIFGLGVVLLEIGRSRLLLEPSSSVDGSDAAEAKHCRKGDQRTSQGLQPSSEKKRGGGGRAEVPGCRSEMYFVGGRRRSFRHGSAEELL